MLTFLILLSFPSVLEDSGGGESIEIPVGGGGTTGRRTVPSLMVTGSDVGGNPIIFRVSANSKGDMVRATGDTGTFGSYTGESALVVV